MVDFRRPACRGLPSRSVGSERAPRQKLEVSVGWSWRPHNAGIERRLASRLHQKLVVQVESLEVESIEGRITAARMRNRNLGLPSELELVVRVRVDESLRNARSGTREALFYPPLTTTGCSVPAANPSCILRVVSESGSSTTDGSVGRDVDASGAAASSASSSAAIWTLPRCLTGRNGPAAWNRSASAVRFLLDFAAHGMVSSGV